eukprot:TRINITY_DN95_c0_g1_i1.p1 TRINITY_DN95_c0_g1~~TRINITY_DN95_c0_g1_i1.p1  ORF type:complete len:299 (+),score=87.50 TRINITY_DN95_c0_g1_i1:37-933(+)
MNKLLLFTILVTTAFAQFENNFGSCQFKLGGICILAIDYGQPDYCDQFDASGFDFSFEQTSCFCDYPGDEIGAATYSMGPQFFCNNGNLAFANALNSSDLITLESYVPGERCVYGSCYDGTRCYALGDLPCEVTFDYLVSAGLNTSDTYTEGGICEDGVLCEYWATDDILACGNVTADLCDDLEGIQVEECTPLECIGTSGASSYTASNIHIPTSENEENTGAATEEESQAENTGAATEEESQAENTDEEASEGEEGEEASAGTEGSASDNEDSNADESSGSMAVVAGVSLLLIALAF